MAAASHVKVTNKTGKTATDLHITLRGSGNKLQVDPGSIRPRDGGKPPRVPSNADNWPAGNELVIEWDRGKVENDEEAEFDVATEIGPLELIPDSGPAETTTERILAESKRKISKSRRRKTRGDRYPIALAKRSSA